MRSSSAILGSATLARKAGPLRIFNTLTRRKETIKPLKDKRLGMYACGLTVYDFAHIGNLRTYVLEDILRRVLEFNGFKVKHVMNITDVGHLTSDADTGEDKMEVGARRERKTAWEISEYYTKLFLDDEDKLNIEKPQIIPRATRHISEMIKLIRLLEKKGYTYVIDDGVYFDTSKSKGYGRLARLEPGGMLPGARVEVNPQKRNPSDFALWKSSPKGTKRDMEWDSPWGVGFPGWHIECSAMSMKYLGKTLDIHCGGVDHIPIHHTNEIAQSEGATGKKFVDYWMHAAHLIVDGKRMAKSLGNFYTLKDVIDRGYDPMSLRFFYIQGHYRREVNFTYEGLDAARNALNSISDFVRRLKEYDGEKKNARVKALVLQAGTRFTRAMNDDVNTPEALAILFRFMTHVNRLMGERNISKADAGAILELMLLLDKVLGLSLNRSLKKQALSEQVEILVSERELARKIGDYARADAIRSRLREEFGIVLEDTPSGVKWRRVG
jgi:cysteinyl-tRNA synthetase